MINKAKPAAKKQYQKFATGKKVYSNGTNAPTRGTVDPTGYVQREMRNQGPRRSGLAKAAINRVEKRSNGIAPPRSSGIQIGNGAVSQPGGPAFGAEPQQVTPPASAPVGHELSAMQQNTYYKNGLDLRHDFERGAGTINAAKGVPGAYLNSQGAWQMDMKPENYQNYVDWKRQSMAAAGYDATAQLGSDDWYGAGTLGGSQAKGFNKTHQAAVDPQQAEAAQRRQASERSYWDDVNNAQGMGWAAPTNPGYGQQAPDWYNALGQGTASAAGYQRQTPYGLMSQNQLQQDQARGALPMQPPGGAQRDGMFGMNTNVGPQQQIINDPQQAFGVKPSGMGDPGWHTDMPSTSVGGPYTQQQGTSFQPAPNHQQQQVQQAAQARIANSPTAQTTSGTPQAQQNTGQTAQGQAAAPSQPPSMQVSANGQLDLPYDENFAWDMLGAKNDMNNSLLDLQMQQQQQALSYGQQKRQGEQGYQDLKRNTLNNDAARGTAFSSQYGRHVGDNATNYNNFMSEMDASNQLFNQGIDASRMQIGNNFNDLLRNAALRRSQDLEGDAGSLGFGQGSANPTIPKPTFPTAKPKAQPKPKANKPKPKAQPKHKPPRRLKKK